MLTPRQRCEYITPGNLGWIYTIHIERSMRKWFTAGTAPVPAAVSEFSFFFRQHYVSQESGLCAIVRQKFVTRTNDDTETSGPQAVLN